MRSFKYWLLQFLVKRRPERLKRATALSSIYRVLKDTIDDEDLKRINLALKLTVDPNKIKSLRYPMAMRQEIWGESGIAIIKTLVTGVDRSKVERVWNIMPPWLRYSYMQFEKDVVILFRVLEEHDEQVQA